MPRPAHIHWRVVAIVGLERELRFSGKQFVAEDPVRVQDEMLTEVVRVVVLENASYLHIGKRKGFSQVFHPTSLNDRFIESLADEVGDGAVRFDGSGVN